MPLRKLLVTSAIGLVAVLVAACSMGGAIATPAGREFLSVGVTDGGAAKPLVAGTQIRLRFDDEGGLSASAGCNIIGGSYRIDGTTLVFEGGGMTEMGCDQERHAQDDWLSEFLASKPAVSLVASDLTLTSGATVVRLLDREVAQPDANIVGPTWTVVSIITGDAVSSVPDGAIATLNFAADGSVKVNTGCNQGQGRWSNAGGGITFSDVILTKKACGGVEGQLEGAMQPIIGGNAAATIDADMLTLQSGAAGLQLQAR